MCRKAFVNQPFYFYLSASNSDCALITNVSSCRAHTCTLCGDFWCCPNTTIEWCVPDGTLYVYASCILVYSVVPLHGGVLTVFSLDFSCRLVPLSTFYVLSLLSGTLYFSHSLLSHFHFCFWLMTLFLGFLWGHPYTSPLSNWKMPVQSHSNLAHRASSFINP